MKAKQFEKVNSYNKLARYCASLTNPRRTSLIEAIASKPNCVRNTYIEVEGLNKFAVGTNLKYLKRFGIINGVLTTKHLEYCINYESIEEFKHLFDDFYNKVMAHKNRVNQETCNG
ncbi:MAG TPA: hypothetical protein VN698_14070 [Bacteroidia bacterium]|nr:hypothetical protein [Bacteroidia bacterium]